MFRKVPPLRSEEPEAFLNLCVQVDEVFVQGLVDDRRFVMRILPLGFGCVLRVFGNCLRAGNGWAECKGRLLKEYFPQFVRERLVRELIVFNSHQEGRSLRGYVEQVFCAASFLRFGTIELQLVDRIVMHLHPSVRDQAELLERPRSRNELHRVIGLIEEMMTVVKEG